MAADGEMCNIPEDESWVGLADQKILEVVDLCISKSQKKSLVRHMLKGAHGASIRARPAHPNEHVPGDWHVEVHHDARIPLPA
jgi:hypothetical protein